MIHDLYEYLTSFREVGGDMKSRLQDIGVQEVFEPLIKDELFHDGDKFNSTLFYILDCYSKNSKKHIADIDWIVIKKSVAKAVQLPDDLKEAVMDLKSESVAQTIRNWFKYQNSPVFEQLCVLKDLRQQMLKSSLEMLAKGKNEINWEQKDKNAQKAARLLKDIEKLEGTLKAATMSKQDAETEFKEKTGQSISPGLSPENNSEIK